MKGYPGVDFSRFEEIDGLQYAVYGQLGRSVLYPSFRLEAQMGLSFEADRALIPNLLAGMARLKLIWHTFADDMPPGKGEIDFLELRRYRRAKIEENP